MNCEGLIVITSTAPAGRGNAVEATPAIGATHCVIAVADTGWIEMNIVAEPELKSRMVSAVSLVAKGNAEDTADTERACEVPKGWKGVVIEVAIFVRTVKILRNKGLLRLFFGI
jgi:hypothetical protein